VLLALVANGLEVLLRGRGEPVDRLVLQAVVPVAMRPGQRDPNRGNVLGQMIVPLPLGQADFGAGLRLIAEQTAERRRAAGPRHVPVLRSRTLQRAAMALAAHQRAFNVYVANVRGPESFLQLAGHRLVEAFPMVPLMGNLTLGVGAVSYAGQFNILMVADRATCPDVHVFANALESALASLT
jgi:diacylglycerol O-acyltransferase / wax synthase